MLRPKAWCKMWQACIHTNRVALICRYPAQQISRIAPVKTLLLALEDCINNECKGLTRLLFNIINRVLSAKTVCLASTIKPQDFNLLSAQRPSVSKTATTKSNLRGVPSSLRLGQSLFHMSRLGTYNGRSSARVAGERKKRTTARRKNRTKWPKIRENNPSEGETTVWWTKKGWPIPDNITPCPLHTKNIVTPPPLRWVHQSCSQDQLDWMSRSSVWFLPLIA